MTERAVPILPGDDLAAGREFYVGKLGFTVQFEATEDGHSGILGLARGPIELTIDCPMSGHGRNACASLRVHDADALYREWQEHVAISRPPRDEDWGGRTFDLQDPFGNTLFVIGPVVPESRSPAAPLAIGCAAPFFIVRSVPAALAFYRDRLGFDVTFQGPTPDDVFFGIVQRGKAMLMLKDVGVDPLPNHTRDVGKGWARWDAYVHVPDPDALAAEFSSRHVGFFRPLGDDDDGLRGFEVKDSDGYVLFFGRPRA